jgi:hypothetical protein
MSLSIENSRWVYVVVQDSGDDPHLLGQHDAKNEVSFIPAFLDKGAARTCLPLMAKDSDRTYEVQAMRFDAVKDYAATSGFAVYVMEADGTVIGKAEP